MRVWSLLCAGALAGLVAGCGADATPGGDRDAGGFGGDGDGDGDGPGGDGGCQGEGCDEPVAAEEFDPVLLVRDLADPDVLELAAGGWVMSGTQGGRSLPIYRSSDLESFELSHRYDPSALDPEYDYCDLWAPDLSALGAGVQLYFSAHRVAEGTACPPPAGQTVTTFQATAQGAALEFDVPKLVNEGTSFPRSRIESGCPADGCSRVIRIDSSIYDDGGERWFYYVWFEGGNNISAFRLDDPGQVVHVTGPALFGDELSAEEESINEGPDVFFRDGRYYLFFSGAFFDSQYAMYYVMAPTVAELTRERAVRRHSQAVRAASGELVESHGHNTIVESGGVFYNVYHQGVFEAGNLIRRDTYLRRLAFRDDGSLHAHNLVRLRWGSLPDHAYSLDVVLRDGTVIGPCIGAGRIGQGTSALFDGVCPSGGDRLVPKSKVAAFRLYYSDDGTWGGERSVEVAYDGFSEDLFVPLPRARTEQVALRWNELATGAQYSLDVQLEDGTWIAPCDSAAIIDSRVEHTFTGRCRSAEVDVPMTELATFRVCSAVGGNWDQATCAERAWDGVSGHLSIALPE